jgi:hypothetical protein
MKTRLKQILEQIDPNGEFFTEGAINELSDAFEGKLRDKITEAETKLLEKHQQELSEVDNDHAEKMRELVEDIDSDHATKIDIIIENIDKQHASDVETLLEEVDEDHTRKIEFVIEKIEMAHEEQVKTLVTELDATHTAKLEEVVDTVQQKFTEKIKEIDLEHVDKLNKIVEFYETKHTDDIVVKVSDYLDLFIESFSTEGLGVEDKLKLEALEGIFESVRSQLGVAGKPVFMKEATDDSKIDELIVENEKLTSQLKQMEAKQLLNEKTESMSLDESAYIRKHFANSTTDEINSDIHEVVQAYKNQKQISRQKLSDEYVGQGVSVDIPVQHIETDAEMLSENLNIDPEAESVAKYADLIKKTYKK